MNDGMGFIVCGEQLYADPSIVLHYILWPWPILENELFVNPANASMLWQRCHNVQATLCECRDNIDPNVENDVETMFRQCCVSIVVTSLSMLGANVHTTFR